MYVGMYACMYVLTYVGIYYKDGLMKCA
jgi:hypothetical protein